MHHNLFRRWYDQRGNERNGGTYFKDDLYFTFLVLLYLLPSGVIIKSYSDFIDILGHILLQ